MNRDVNYNFVAQRLVALTDGIPYETANLANASALLWQYLPDINWVGFYKMTGGLLVLGGLSGGLLFKFLVGIGLAVEGLGLGTVIVHFIGVKTFKIHIIHS